MSTKGTFEVTMSGEPPFDVEEGVALSRAKFEKRFSGPLDGTSRVQMLAARTPVDGSAAYVAVERITGVLDGKRGSFVCVHTGIMTRGARSLTIAIVPDSGTGELAGIAGRMDIQVEQGNHRYEIEYTLTPT